MRNSLDDQVWFPSILNAWSSLWNFLVSGSSSRNVFNINVKQLRISLRNVSCFDPLLRPNNFMCIRRDDLVIIYLWGILILSLVNVDVLPNSRYFACSDILRFWSNFHVVLKSILTIIVFQISLLAPRFRIQSYFWGINSPCASTV